MELKGEKLYLHVTYDDRFFARQINGRRWVPDARAWEIPATPDSLLKVREFFPDIVIPQEVVAKIAEQARLVQEIAALKDLDDAEIEIPTKTTPMAHQRKGVAMAIRVPAFAFFFEQGTGKTKTAIDTTAVRYVRDRLRRVLVVAPTSVVPVWPAEYGKHCGVPHDVRALEGSIKERERALAEWAPDPNILQVAVLNYDGMRMMQKPLIAWLKKTPGTSMVILDEAHRIKTPTSKQSKVAAEIGQAADFRLALTGTPVTQGPQDYFALFRFLDPKIFGTSYRRFLARYAQMGGYGGYQIVAWPGLQELVQKVHSIAYRVTKAEAIDLPPEVDQTIYVELGRHARSLYDTLRDESIAALSKERKIIAQNVLVRLLRLQQITGGFAQDEIGAEQVDDAKLRALEDLLEDLLAQEGKKVVIFARFRPEIAAIRRMLEDKGIGYRHIDGSVSQSDRGTYVEDFQTDPTVRVFVAQIQAAGLGITLTAADTAIFYSLDFSLANFEQARARISRIGQTAKMTYIHLVARRTVDEKVLGALQKKQSIADLVVNRWRDFF